MPSDNLETRDIERVDRAIEAIEAGLHSEAEALLLEVIQNAPMNYVFSEMIGGQAFMRFWDSGRFTHYVNWPRQPYQEPEMIVWLRSAYPRAYYYLGFLMVKTGQYERAIEYLDRGRALEPTNPAFAMEKATALAFLGRLEGALELHEGIQRTGPFVTDEDLAVSLRGRGFILVEMGELDSAETAFRESLAIDPENQLARDELESLAHLRGRGVPADRAMLTVDGACDPETNRRLPARENVRNASPPGDIEQLQQRFHEGGARDRKSVVEELQPFLGDPRCLALLEQASFDDHERVRTAARGMLYQAGEDGAKILGRALLDPSKSLQDQMQTVAVLLAMGSKAASAEEAVLRSLGGLLRSEEGEPEVEAELRRAFIAIWVEALWEIGVPSSRIRKALADLPTLDLATLAALQAALDSFYPAPELMIEWQEVAEGLSCGHGVAFYHSDVGRAGTGPPVAFLKGYEWKHEPGGPVIAWVLEPDSEIFRAGGLDGRSILEESKVAVTQFLRDFLTSGMQAPNRHRYGNLSIWYNA